MTEQELIRNITKGYYYKSNYYNTVRHLAYIEMKAQHTWCDYYKKLKKEIIDSGLNIHPDMKVTIYNKKHKKVMFTKYTKVPKYRTYRQQLAITNRSLYKRLKDRLYERDYMRQIIK